MRVQIGLDSLFPGSQSSQPDLPIQLWPALVDTGAEESCIDSRLADILRLPIVDRREVAGAHGAEELNYHLAQIYVPDLNYTIYGEFAGVHLVAGGLPFLALIGRTFLQHFTMTYDGRTGQVTLSND